MCVLSSRVANDSKPDPTHVLLTPNYYLEAEPKGLSFPILSTSIILQRTMVILDFFLLRGYIRSLNKGTEMIINFKKRREEVHGPCVARI